MWNLTLEAKKAFTQCNLLPINETDEEWGMVLSEAKEEGEDIHTALKDELEDVKAELQEVLPKLFLPYLEDGTLNQPDLPATVRGDYLQWIKEQEEKFEDILDAAYMQTTEAAASLSSTAQAVFAAGIHDFAVERLERKGNELHLFVNTEGGFSTASYIHFHFENITAEEDPCMIMAGQYMLYSELKKTKDGFALRVLLDCPETEWTIHMEKINAACYYRPSIYTQYRAEEKLEDLAWNDFVKQLNGEHSYWLITQDILSPIQSFTNNVQLVNGKVEFEKNKIIITSKNSQSQYSLAEYHLADFLYTDIYEDPDSQSNEPLAVEELEAAILEGSIEMQVRAWNTIYHNPEKHLDLINSLLLQVEITEENEMLLSVYLTYFYEKDILTDEVSRKYQSLLL
ncbi:DUF4085 family protein [Niallia sp. Man26]|uniref:DUF4085 family protein n=1 Tax=Niallia sp. Man26 TaxID=2912824 RepID=UPI001EDAD4E6|nr:DUF4085 family protein [Niallia sp. Man26]UPO90697.1 DUF4085 domain-containing protein [Niallia sp. Man26]